ncbi:protein kinase-like protein [Leptomonas pyrrhocoris]|uniref:Protein kinase-like protein n=1 Tax=Leptomonas pyrrhocoris TaxID=157538 RepID=A0A0M9G6H8_LEPPY|nr:protein kinase-like protein [Leptomonas pyrrhocoris]KPA83423.1 protein kinase-like protein [Leptomonas pyrrhocoris]|eukprot:XP_015661862.1 protein kinase-like protein [Leptomonas pyrrhocoris]
MPYRSPFCTSLCCLPDPRGTVRSGAAKLVVRWGVFVLLLLSVLWADFAPCWTSADPVTGIEPGSQRYHHLRRRSSSSCFFIPVTLAAATTVHYRGSVYHGLTEEMVRQGGSTFSIQVSIPTFPTNITLLHSIVRSILTNNIRLIDDSGHVIDHLMQLAPTVLSRAANRSSAAPWPSWRRSVTEVIMNSEVEVSANGHFMKVTFGKGSWLMPPHTSALVVPCLPFSLFEQVGRLGLQDLPNNCLAGDPFLVRKRSFLQLDKTRWGSSRQFFVTGGSISIPLNGASNTVSDKFALEQRLRVMEGYTCLHTRGAFVRGSRWDIQESAYRFTPHRGGVQTLCYAPYPETLPFLRLKLADSYEVAGPEGVSTDPPQVHAELEFTGTIYGTNLTERDTAVITDELCTDFTSQNVFFVDLFFSSSSRVSFFGTFHKRGIYHVCYHREGSPVYVRVSTLLVERGTDVVIDNDSPNVLIDQDVKLLQSASVTRLKVQDKGNLNLRQRSLNVSYFVWSGGSISGKGTINCTGYAKITTQGYETRQLSVPLYNYGEMTIDVQRLSLERDGAIHNYGNLTLAVSSMGMDSISSVLSAGRRNTITNYPGGILRIIALDERSYALLTGRLNFLGGSVLLSGKINLTDASNLVDSVMVLKAGSHATVHNTHISGNVVVEEHSVLTMMENCVLLSTNATGDGLLEVVGDDAVLNSVNVGGTLRANFGVGLHDPISITVYGTTQFDQHTLVHVGNAHFVTSTGLAKLMFGGRFLAAFVTARFNGNMILQISGVTALYGNVSDEAVIFDRDSGIMPGYSLPLATSTFVPPNATMFVLDTFRWNNADHGTHGAGNGSVRRDNLVGDNMANAMHGEGSGAMAITACEVYLPTSQYLTLGGRLVLRGCLQMPSGGLLSGDVVRLEEPKDWKLLYASFCTGPDAEAMPDFCRHRPHAALPLHSGLALSEKVYVRYPARIVLDEVALISSYTRVTDAMQLQVKETLLISTNSTLWLMVGMTVEARRVIVDGTLVVADPRNTIFKGDVEVREGGVIEVRGASQVSCANELTVKGRLYVSHTAKRHTFRCVDANHEGPPPREVETHTGGSNGNSGGRVSVQTELLRQRVLVHMRPDMYCPSDVMEDYDERRRLIDLYWMKEPYNPPPGEPKLRDMAWMTLFGVVSGFATFHLLLTTWNCSYKDWWADIHTPCPLQLTLTWDELSYSAVNYFAFCRLIIINLQNTMAAFHPGLPAPLPTVAIVFLRGMGLLMPHHQSSICRAHMVGAFYIIWLLVFLYLQGRESRLISYLRHRQPFVLNLLQKLYSVLTILNVVFLAPLMSSVLDAVAWPTLLRNVPTYEPMPINGWVVVSVIAFLAIGVLAPSSILSNQTWIPHMDLRARASSMFLHFPVQMVETVMWKVFYSNPMCAVLSCVVFQLLRLVLMWAIPPTPYRNVNRFMCNTALYSFYVYPTIILYTVLVRTGVYTSCTQGVQLFRLCAALFVISLFANFWRNILFAEEQTTTTGDVSIDALRCSMMQIRNRIHDIKMEVYACNDTIERENTLNAIARLRIEYLEKQERYRYETHRLLRPYILGGPSADCEMTQSHNSSPYYNVLDGDDMSTALPLMSPSIQHSNLLTVEEMETFSCGPALGKGSYGTVHLGILTNGRLVAVKYINIVSQSPEALSSVKAEVNMLRELSHPNIIRYYGAHTIHETMLVFMEFAVGGSLTSIVRKFTQLTEAVMQLYTHQILQGLLYLHEKGVVHRDIKGENILIDGYGVAKLADFGCSKALANIANATQVGCGTLVGSPFWMAPEVIRSEAYGTKADIWSVGCTVVEMLNGGEPPWREEFDNVYSAMFYVGSTNDIPQIPEETSELCRNFLFRCFERDVQKRASAEELLQHPWLRSAAAASMMDESSENTTSFSTFSPASQRLPYDGLRNINSPHGSPHESREDVTSPLKSTLGSNHNNGTKNHHQESSIASSASDGSKK